MEKKKLQNITHLTLNTGDIVIYEDDSVIMDSTKPYMRKLTKQLRKLGKAPVPGDFNPDMALKCLSLTKCGYIAALHIKTMSQVPLIITAGSLTAEDGRSAWEVVWDLHKTIWEDSPQAMKLLCRPDVRNIKCPQAPFICDLLCPAILLRPHITKWTGDFTKCLGITMLQMLSDRRCNVQ